MKNFIFLLSIIVLTACSSKIKPSITSEDWGSIDSKPVYLYALTNSNGIIVKITNYGGMVVEFLAPDKNGKMENIVLGPANLEDVSGHPALGRIIGRYANRIGGAKFTLDGTEYTLAANNGRNHIHGGIKQLAHKVWNATISCNESSATLSLVCATDDMEEGYPGNMTVKVDYVLNNDNELQIHYAATTDKPTVLNLTNHAYFNLTGGKENVCNHQVRIYADEYTPVDDEKIPTGEIAPVEGTPFDLRQWTTINDRLTELPYGYDNNFCVKVTPENATLAAELYEPQSGRLLQTFTTEPGVQFYTAGSMNSKRTNSHGVTYSPFMGACFEAQHYPDSPNKPNFPTTVLRPGEKYTQITIYKVGVK